MDNLLDIYVYIFYSETKPISPYSSVRVSLQKLRFSGTLLPISIGIYYKRSYNGLDSVNINSLLKTTCQDVLPLQVRVLSGKNLKD